MEIIDLTYSLSDIPKKLQKSGNRAEYSVVNV